MQFYVFISFCILHFLFNLGRHVMTNVRKIFSSCYIWHLWRRVTGSFFCCHQLQYLIIYLLIYLIIWPITFNISFFRKMTKFNSKKEFDGLKVENLIEKFVEYLKQFVWVESSCGYLYPLHTGAGDKHEANLGIFSVCEWLLFTK